ncbi:hypothetical protein HPB52_023407 [Rhipicephalus sanguineus]|uniref:Uncharacterized protein n=1 Tax=Rhipicephalus sanguineus TaxID=34632 RepID=A0A9D4SP08_RHISA|nr:hypothetical protein HPB52_023407 [Rhipicephalus sanguineus]
MAAPNQVTGYDPESLRIHAQGKSAPSVASQRAKQLQWRPKNTPRIEKDDIIVVLKPRETLDIKAAFGPGQAGAAVRSILGADAMDAAEKLLRDITLPVGGRQLPFPGHPKLCGEFCRGVVHVSQDETSETVKSKLSAEPNVVTVRKLGDTPVAVITFAGTKWATEQILVRDRSLDAAQAAGSRYLLLLLMAQAQQNTNASRAASSAAPKTAGGHKPNKPEPKKAHTGPSTSVKSGTPWKPPVLMVKDFPPLTPVQAQQQIEELRRQNRFLARKIQELEAKQVGSSEPEQGTEVEDGDDGSSVTSDLTSVSRRDGDTVVGSGSATGANGRLESLERKTEQLEERVAALPNQIMSAVRASFQDMFTAALTQALPEIVAQVSDSVLKAVQPWVASAQVTSRSERSVLVLDKAASQCCGPLRKSSRPEVAAVFTGGPCSRQANVSAVWGQASRQEATVVAHELRECILVSSLTHLFGKVSSVPAYDVHPTHGPNR